MLLLQETWTFNRYVPDPSTQEGTRNFLCVSSIIGRYLRSSGAKKLVKEEEGNLQTKSCLIKNQFKKCKNKSLRFVNPSNATCLIVQSEEGKNSLLEGSSFTSVEGKQLPVQFRKYRIGPKITTEFIICDKKITVRVDEGSNISIISPEFLTSVRPAVHREYEITPLSVKTAIGSTLLTRFVELLVSQSEKEYLWGFHVMPKFTENILVGTDWTRRDSDRRSECSQIMVRSQRGSNPIRKSVVNFPVSEKSEKFSTDDTEISRVIDISYSEPVKLIWKCNIVSSVTIPPWKAVRVRVHCPNVISGSVILSPNRDLQFTHRLMLPFVYAVIENHETDI